MVVPMPAVARLVAPRPLAMRLPWALRGTGPGSSVPPMPRAKLMLEVFSGARLGLPRPAPPAPDRPVGPLADELPREGKVSETRGHAIFLTSKLGLSTDLPKKPLARPVSY